MLRYSNFTRLLELLVLCLAGVMLAVATPVLADRDWERGSHAERGHRGERGDRGAGRDSSFRQESRGDNNRRWSRAESKHSQGNSERPARPIANGNSSQRNPEGDRPKHERKQLISKQPSRPNYRHEQSRQVEEGRQHHRLSPDQGSTWAEKPRVTNRELRSDADRHAGRKERMAINDRVRDRNVRESDRHRHDYNYSPRRQTVYHHSYRGRPNYRLHQRERYVYYRSPWYSTRYLAPIHIHYHPIGYRINHLPINFVRIAVRDFPFFYFGGIFYREFSGGYVVVEAPIGAVVSELPVGYIAFNNGIDTYFYANTAYYRWSDSDAAFVVVKKPEGADDAIEAATSERLYAYPNAGQSEAQQAEDRYQCHQWAVSETQVDPTLEDESEDLAAADVENYRRALSACLAGRDYTVK